MNKTIIIIGLVLLLAVSVVATTVLIDDAEKNVSVNAYNSLEEHQKYKFDSQGEGEEYYTQSPAEFISIDGDGNRTTVHTATPTFNWTVDANTSQYWLQIATDSLFANLAVNLTDINEFNYPTYYDENSTRVSFTLPNENSLIANNTYYCKVEPYQKGSG